MGANAGKERPDHATKPRRFGPSRAIVQAAQGQVENQVVAQIRTILGRPRATLQDAANLAGAPDDALVTVAVLPMHGSRIIEIQVESPSVKLRILLYRRFDGKPILEDDQIDVSEEIQRQGHGARLIGRQVEHAIRLGVAEIRGYATRDDQTGDVGYWVWPLFGFDGRLPEKVLDRLPLDLAGARRVNDLILTSPGRLWWFENGESINVAFDLGPHSPNLRWFRGYLRRKGLP
jgi:GNAT superfamily N-acetyltransferase